MKKQSIYNIWIDSILYNTLSDSAISFNQNEVEGIRYYLENLSEFETDYPEIVQKLNKSGFIIDESFDELEYILFKNRIETLQNRSYHLTINPTLQCNYRCWYCCVEDQNTKYEQRRMDDETIEKLKKHIKYIIETDRISQLRLDWFGGEPLMYYYEVVYPVSKYAADLCKTNNIPFANHATTNAYYMDDKMIRSFNEINLNSFQIPIDGNEKKHNFVKNHEGNGHYRQILNSINNIVENVNDANVIMRINYDKQTLNSVNQVIDDIKPENQGKIFVDFQRVWQVALTKDENGNNTNLIKIKREFDNAGFKTSYFAYRGRNYFKCCYADSFYHRVINYDGKLYKCSARDYDEKLCIGTLNDDGSIYFNREIISKMFSDATFKNKKCLNCVKLPMCFGPCIQKYYEIKTGQSAFQCLHEAAEISLKSYVKDKIELLQQNENVKI